MKFCGLFYHRNSVQIIRFLFLIPLLPKIAYMLNASFVKREVHGKGEVIKAKRQLSSGMGEKGTVL